MDIEYLRKKCKTSSKKKNYTLDDFKAVYYLWKDPAISKTKLVNELKRSMRTLEKINQFLEDYIVRENPDLSSEKFLKKALTLFLSQ